MGGVRILLAGVLAAALIAPAAEAARTMRVSVGSEGEQGNGHSGAVGSTELSRRGKAVAFLSDASNLVPGDRPSAVPDLFVHDRRILGGATRIVGRGPSLTRDGWELAYLAGARRCPRVHIYDLVDDKDEEIPIGRTDAPESHLSVADVALSPEGRYVATVSSEYSFGLSCDRANADESGGVDRTNGRLTLFNRTTRRATEIDTSALMRHPGEVELSAWARTIVVTEYGSDERIWAIDRRSGDATPIGVDPRGRAGGYVAKPAVSHDGRFVAFTSTRKLVRGDGGQDPDVFVTDLRSRRTVRASVGTGGAGPGDSASPSISDDGRRVAFASSDGLAGGRTNVYLRDLARRTTRLVSVRRNGKRTKHSGAPAISGDGRWVSFSSRADDLVRRDTNRVFDVFVRGPFR